MTAGNWAMWHLQFFQVVRTTDFFNMTKSFY